MALPALDLVASHILSAYHATRKRKAVERKPNDPSESQPSSRQAVKPSRRI